jgi:two-component system nitrate/nitrite response regulator NarL
MKFLLIEDEWQIRDATAGTLQSINPGAEVLEASSLGAAFRLLVDSGPIDLILLDLNVEDCRGIETLRRLSSWKEAHDCNARVVVISGEDDVDLVRHVIESYGTGFILKASPRQIFAQALALTIAGGVYLPEVLCGRLASQGKTSSAEARPASLLTPRECEIAGHLIQGKTYKRIALDLEKKDGKPTSEHTVRAHVSNIAWKLGVSENAKAGVMAEIARRGLTFPAA